MVTYNVTARPGVAYISALLATGVRSYVQPAFYASGYPSRAAARAAAKAAGFYVGVTAVDNPTSLTAAAIRGWGA